MAYVTPIERAERALGFLLALRNPKIMDLMVLRGFRQADLDEGFQLLRQVAPAKVPDVGSQNHLLEERPVDLLSRWQDAWLPMAVLALRRREPELAKLLLDDLHPAPVLAVAGFLDRLAQLDEVKGARRGRQKGRGVLARVLLAERGLTAEVLRQGRELVERVKAGQASAREVREDEASFAKADEELWQYYLQWSQIARMAVKEKSLLRQLGFRPAGRPRKKDAAGAPAGDGKVLP